MEYTDGSALISSARWKLRVASPYRSDGVVGGAQVSKGERRVGGQCRGPFERRDGLGRPRRRDENDPFQQWQAPVRGTQTGRLPHIYEGGWKVTLPKAQIRAGVEQIRTLRIPCHRSVQGGGGRFELTEFDVDRSQGDGSDRQLRFELHRPSRIRFRLLDPGPIPLFAVLAPVGQPQAGIRRRIVALEVYRSLEGLDAPIRVALAIVTFEKCLPDLERLVGSDRGVQPSLARQRLTASQDAGTIPPATSRATPRRRRAAPAQR